MRMKMSDLHDTRSAGVTNPAAQFPEGEEEDMQYILEKGMCDGPVN